MSEHDDGHAPQPEPMPHPRLSVVIPVYNEEKILHAARAAVRSAGLDLPVRLLAVDDGSSDGTRASLARLKAQDDAIGFISFTRNFGKEAAIHAGLQQACGPLQARVMVVIDADGIKAALFVDALVGQHQVVIKSLEANYRRVNGISGATIMGDGHVALILDVSAIAGMAKSSVQKAG